MDNRKRPRMETTGKTTPSLNGGVGTTTATATIGGQSIFLTNASAADTLGVLPANVFLTICDDNSDESDEYLTIDSNTLAQIKQEQDIGTQTQTLPLQYRIINQLQRQPMSPTESSATASLSSLNSQTLPGSVQLPSGCEIYLVKEYVETPATTTVSASSGSNDLFVQTPVTSAATSTTTIKVEPVSPIAARTRTGAVAASSDGIAGVGNVQIIRGNIPCLVTTKVTPTNATKTTSSASAVEGNNGKRSFILEAYKKRDDKRRATHNEVERRRRDKINSWIFKLKEMLPTEMPNNNIIVTTTNTATNTINNNSSAAVTSTSLSSEQQQQQRNNNINNSRSPPSDSKSQILIKACDYIKAMQDEIKSLRECLTENENLRLSNQRLQNELNKIRNERSNSNNLVNGNSSCNNNNNNNNPNSNYNITLNSLNSNGIFGAGTATVIGNVNHGATAAYNKRELIITDYVD